MTTVHWLQGVEFEWDEDKAQSNSVKHGVTFFEAAEVFFDPFYQTGEATQTESIEQRDFILGYSATLRLLLVVDTERGERTRIISARPATRPERKSYESS
ncbi:MAG: BrnT family toxin [Roseiflexaceae bacterium]|nr:BrnT family toxin [Roseiflexaceae bacterium]